MNVKAWSIQNKLILNDSKTDVVFVVFVTGLCKVS